MLDADRMQLVLGQAVPLSRFEQLCAKCIEVFAHVDFGEPQVVGIIDMSQQLPEVVDAMRITAPRLGHHWYNLTRRQVLCRHSTVTFIDGRHFEDGLLTAGGPGLIKAARFGLVDFRYHRHGQYGSIESGPASVSRHTHNPNPQQT